MTGDRRRGARSIPIPFSRSLVATTALIALVGVLGCGRDPGTRKVAFFDSGNRYFAASKFAEAIIEYQNAIEIDPKYAAAHARLAEAYERVGDAGHALAQYVRAADLSPDDPNLQIKAGTYLLAAGRVDDAKARAESVITRDPKNAAAHVLLGNAMAGVKDLDGAIAQVEEAIRLEPGRGTAYATLGVMEFARGRNAEAEDALQKAVTASPQWIGGHLALANYYWAVNRLSDAERAFQAALTVAPDHVLANRAMAAFYIATGRPADAEQYLRRVARPDAPASVLVLADYYLASGRPKDAIPRLESVRSDTRARAAAEERLVRAFIAVGDRTRAYTLAEEMIKRDPKDANAQLVMGQLLFDDGQREQALQHVRTALQANPRSAMAQFALGRLYAARGDLQAAEAAFTAVLKENPRAAAAQIELARLQLITRRVDASVSSARDALSTAPASADARLALIRALLAKGDYAAADRELELLDKAYPNLPAGYAQRGVLLASRKDLRSARAAFDRALELDPSSLEAIGGLTALDLAAGDVARAQARIDARLAAAPSPGLLLLGARTRAAANDLPSAEKFLRRAIESDPTTLPAYAMLGQLYVQQHRLNEGKREFAQLAARQSKPVAALTMIGIISQMQGDLSGAERDFQKVLTVDPNAAVAANNLAWLYAARGTNLDVALQLARTAVAGLPDVAEASDTLGWILYLKNLPDLAVTTLSQTVGRDPRNPIYQYHLGMAYVKVGDPVRARATLERALAIAENFDGAEDARRALSELRNPAKH